MQSKEVVTMASLLADAALFVTLSMLCVSAACRNVDAGLQEELLTRIQSLENQGREQAEKMHKMEVQIEAQNERLASQEATITEYKERVRGLERAVVGEHWSKRHDVSKLKHGGNKEADNGKHVQSMASVPWQALRQRRGPNFNGDVVAFHALIDPHSEVAHLSMGQSIVFPFIEYNAGSGYHNGTGTFIAPKTGVYIFSVSITSYIKDQSAIVAQIVHNGYHLAAIVAHGDLNHWDQGSATITRYVAAGDEVWVKLVEPADASIWGAATTSFTGCLILPF